MSSRSRYGAGVPCAVAALALVGCGAAQDVTADAKVPDSVALALEGARRDTDVSQAQLEVLREAVEHGRYPTDSEYRSAYDAAVECMVESGVAGVRVDEYWNAGLLQLGVSYSASIDGEQRATVAVVECERVHVDYIRSARASEELIRAAQEAIMNEFLPAIRECLAVRGFPVGQDADFRTASSADLAANEAEGTTTGCMESTGYTNAMTGEPTR